MGKRREMSFDEELCAADQMMVNAPRRHKKHKKHKKKKVEVDYDSDALEVVATESLDPSATTSETEPSAAEKLKSQTNQCTILKMSPPPIATQKLGGKKKKTGTRRDSGTSSEEERWLDAIESGKLEEVDDELKKIKDPKLMTARQRAMYERGNEKEIVSETLMSLPTGYKEKVMTAEAIQKAQLKSQKRKQLADEKREKDKKKTMERLLKKQDSKSGKHNKTKYIRAIVPVISYINNAEGATLTFPPNVDFPLTAQTRKDPPKPILCGIPDCHNLKRYNCSKTNVPLCSFKCYKLNVASIKQIIC